MATFMCALEVVREFRSLLKGTFGPNGLDVMLCSSSGNILITNYGSAVLKSVSLSDPVTRIIVDQIVSHAALTGDGATTFILVLYETLLEICRSLDIRKEKEARELSSKQKQSLTALSKAFTKIEPVTRKILQDIRSKMTLKLLHMSDNKFIISEIIRTHLNGKFPVTIVTLFTDLLCKFIFGGYLSFQKETLDFLIDCFPQLCLEVIGVSVTSSRVIPGILIPREFATDTKKVVPDSGRKFFNFIVIQCLIDEPDQDLNTTLRINCSMELDTALTIRRNKVLQLFHLFQKQGVKLILSTEAVSNVVLHYCRQFKIAFVQMIPTEYVPLICRFAKIQALFYLYFDQTMDLEIYLGKSDCCKTELAGNHGYCHLEFYLGGGCEPLPCQLVLCAPTQGLCCQNSISLKNALKCIRMLFNQDNGELQVLPGAGAVEFILSEELKQYCKTCKDTKLSEACSLFSKGLLTIPRQLHLNSHVDTNQRKNFIHLIPVMKVSWCQEQTPLGINSRTGNVFNPTESNVLEPFLGKQFLIIHILQLIAQLLRVDGVVKVGGKIPTESSFPVLK